MNILEKYLRIKINNIEYFVNSKNGSLSHPQHTVTPDNALLSYFH